MRQFILALMVTGCFAVGQARPSAAAAPDATGLWAQVGSDGQVGGWFVIAERNGVYEGAIVKMFMKPGEDPNPICTKCTGEDKNRPSLGLTLIKGMKRKGLDYEGGTILDPRDGSVYQSIMRLSPDGQKLTVRGYLGISLLGRSQTWTRLPDSAYAQIDPLVLAKLQLEPPRIAAPPAPRPRMNGAPAR